MLTYRNVFIFYLLVLSFAAFAIIPYVDSYYYWLWSKDLQMSYFDGPPLVAYVIRLSTMLFGETVFAINFVGIAIALFTSMIVVKITNLLLGVSRNNYIIGLLWLTSYAVTEHRIITFVTYDGLVNLFELIIIMFALKYMMLRENAYLYLIGIFAGFALLSKYSAIILIVTLIGYFLYWKDLCTVFKQVHVYCAILLCLLIFSPVIIWNYQHAFSSFIFQLKLHSLGIAFTISSVTQHVFYYVNAAVFGPAAPLLIILLVVVIILRKDVIPKIKASFENQLGITFIFVVMLSSFLFWLCMSVNADIPDRFMLLFHSLFILVVGSVLLKLEYNKLLFVIIFANTIYSTANIVTHCLQLKDPECYNLYLESGRLKFISPLKPYIRIHHKASNFCWASVRPADFKY